MICGENYLWVDGLQIFSILLFKKIHFSVKNQQSINGVRPQIVSW